MAKKDGASTKKKSTSAGAGGLTIKVKAKSDGKKGKKGKKQAQEGFEKLTQLADHPLVSDLLAVGAMAAVAAIAEAGISATGSHPGKSSNAKAVKAAGKAAAAAIGQRLISEFSGSLKTQAK